MDMLSKITVEVTIQVFIGEIEKELEVNGNNPEVCVILKKLGRFALTQFEGILLHDRANRYRMLFKESESNEGVAERSLWLLHQVAMSISFQVKSMDNYWKLLEQSFNQGCPTVGYLFLKVPI